MTDRWTPERIGRWKRHVADFTSYLLAAFLVIFATLNADDLGVTLVVTMYTLAAGFLGVPTTLRRDRSRDERDG